jgi:hypothetical protein
LLPRELPIIGAFVAGRALDASDRSYRGVKRNIASSDCASLSLRKIAYRRAPSAPVLLEIGCIHWVLAGFEHF